MKKLFALAAIFALVLAACDWLAKDPPPDDDGGVTIQPASLKINNQSSYKLFDVKYSSVDFGDIDIGETSAKDVTADSPNPVYFDLSVNNTRVQCRTNDLITCNEDSTEERVITNNTVISSVTGGINGTMNSVYAALSKPILELSQNNVVINNDNLIPFDFGNVELTANKSLSFTVKNIGNLPLELNGTPAILSSNALFAIPSQPANTSINPGASAAFLILYTPTAEKEDTGTITIMNNSADPVFALKVKGTGYIKRPQIAVRQGNVTVDHYGEYNFGKGYLGEPSNVTFTIRNAGEANLTFVTVSGNCINIADNEDNAFSVIQQPSGATVIVPGNTATFIIRFSPTVLDKNYTANIQIETNSREPVFSFQIKGTGAKTYQIGDTGPAGGIVFYDAGSAINSWRYLEAAPSDSGDTYWGPSDVFYGTKTEIGSGKQNTQLILTVLKERGDDHLYVESAVRLCADKNTGGFNDWFLPSKDELNEMYKMRTVLGMSGYVDYWSSSQNGIINWGWYTVWLQNFYDGKQSYNDAWKLTSWLLLSVRAIRSF
ncbi:MAG: choice-of-anchor D domain-containing protein [Treponema sp.]|jgi:hypothetical protein|nr:choice-of-anchor D domain-containing protein [Treponema sp.]